jgi:surface protein
MFLNCFSLAYLDISNFKTNNAISMDYMFSGCYSLITLDLSSMDIKDSIYIDGMFYNCYSLLYIKKPNLENPFNFNKVFQNCNSLIHSNN